MSTHNLEHGGIVMHYGPKSRRPRSRSCASSTAKTRTRCCRAAADAGDKIVLSAWYFDESRAKREGLLRPGSAGQGHEVDEGAFEAFRDEFRYKGRERIPAENLQPGMYELPLRRRGYPQSAGVGRQLAIRAWL